MSKHLYGKLQPRSLGFYSINCSDLGLDSAGQWLNAAIKRLDCASSSLIHLVSGVGREAHLLPLIENTVLSVSLQARPQLRLPESINDSAFMQLKSLLISPLFCRKVVCALQ